MLKSSLVAFFIVLGLSLLGFPEVFADQIDQRLKIKIIKSGKGSLIKDEDGNSHDTKQYVQSHFVPDDSAKDARLLAEEWTRIRAERDSLLTETDWMTFADSPALSDDWKTYRQTLRDLPNAQKAKTTYASITWPTKPS